MNCLGELSERDRAAEDVLLIITSPIWAPPAILAFGIGYLYEKCSSLYQYYVLQRIAQTYFAHADSVGTENNCIYWKTRGRYHIVIVRTHPTHDISCRTVICKTWQQDTSYVIDCVDDYTIIRPSYIQSLEDLPETGPNTIVLLDTAVKNIGNYTITLGSYYGIIANKFRIVRRYHDFDEIFYVENV